MKTKRYIVYVTNHNCGSAENGRYANKKIALENAKKHPGVDYVGWNIEVYDEKKDKIIYSKKIN